MKNYYITNAATGRIVRYGTCQDIDYNRQAREGEEIHEGIVNRHKHNAIVGGLLTKVADPPTTQEEQDRAAMIEAAKAMRKKVFKIAFSHENRIRALEGKAGITWDDFKNYVRNNL
jgi:hypothetical protein